MVLGKPYIHWKITDDANLADIDPTYLWGTIIESDKGPIDTPVFITSATQAKRIFNYNLDPFFANGGRYAVIVRAYGVTYDGYKPNPSVFDFTLDEEFEYAYVDYEYYADGDETPKATVTILANTESNLYPRVAPVGTDSEQTKELNVTFSQGRWRECSPEGVIKYYKEVKSGNTVSYSEVAFIVDSITGEIKYYETDACEYDSKEKKWKFKTTESQETGTEGQTGTEETQTEPTALPKDTIIYTKAFNESEVDKVLTVKKDTYHIGDSVIHMASNSPGDFQIPVTVAIDARQGYRVSIKESEDYTLMLSGATSLGYIVQRINERAQNVTAKLTTAGEAIEKVLSGNIITAPIVDEDNDPEIKYQIDTENDLKAYREHINALPTKPAVGSVFECIGADQKTTDFVFKLAETTTYMADGDNGPWNKKLFRIEEKYAVAAHAEALTHLANVKLSGIFCNYGEDKIQKLYLDHVSTTEPQGMNSSEVCKWRELIIGANSKDRIPDDMLGRTFNLYDKAIACDNEYVLYLAQGLIDTGYVPETQYTLDKDGQYKTLKEAGVVEKDYQLLPYQAVQYIAGLRSGLFYGDSIFGGEAKKQIKGVGNLSIAPLVKGENKVFWQPDVYRELNEYGCLTFTEEYGQISLTDGVTTRQSPLEQDEEGVVSIKKYAQHAVHETLQKYIGRNITGDLQTGMEVEVRNVLNVMYTIDKTLIDLPEEGLSAFDVEIVMAPKSDANQILSKVYVYLKITPVHALRQIEVELTVQ